MYPSIHLNWSSTYFPEAICCEKFFTFYYIKQFKWLCKTTRFYIFLKTLKVNDLPLLNSNEHGRRIHDVIAGPLRLYFVIYMWAARLRGVICSHDVITIIWGYCLWLGKNPIVSTRFGTTTANINYKCTNKWERGKVRFTLCLLNTNISSAALFFTRARFLRSPLYLRSNQDRTPPLTRTNRPNV